MENKPSNNEALIGTSALDDGLEHLSVTDVMTLKIPSVFDGDVPFMTFCTNETGQAVECGRLWGNGGVLSFEGNTEESAKVFFEQVVERNMKYIMRSNAELTRLRTDNTQA